MVAKYLEFSTMLLSSLIKYCKDFIMFAVSITTVTSCYYTLTKVKIWYLNPGKYVENV